MKEVRGASDLGGGLRRDHTSAFHAIGITIWKARTHQRQLTAQTARVFGTDVYHHHVAASVASPFR